MRRAIISIMGSALLMGAASGWAADADSEQHDHPAGHHHEMSAMGDHPGHDQEEAVAVPSEPAETRYICPMHPDVQAAESIRCPKCGMRLEPQPLDAEEERSDHDASEAEPPSDHHHER